MSTTVRSRSRSMPGIMPGTGDGSVIAQPRPAPHHVGVVLPAAGIDVDIQRFQYDRSSGGSSWVARATLHVQAQRGRVRGAHGGSDRSDLVARNAQRLDRPQAIAGIASRVGDYRCAVRDRVPVDVETLSRLPVHDLSYWKLARWFARRHEIPQLAAVVSRVGHQLNPGPPAS